MKLRRLLFVAALLAATAVADLGAQSTSSAAEAEIHARLDSTALGWNRGDLAAYLAMYTPDATEMLADGLGHGVDRIERTMREGFWSTGRPAQQLHYEHVEIRMLGEANALVTGQYVLTSSGKPPRTGWFTTVWARTPGGWKMIHDHS